MENQKQASTKSESTANDMFAFFYSEFESLRAKTGIRQWEQLNEQPDAAKAIHDVIDFMVQECNKPPYHIVRTEVKQRVISRAIVEDPEFIGLNAKFVQRALAKWWLVNGDRVMEAMNEHKVSGKVELSPEQKRRIDEIANAYLAELLQGEGPKAVPKVENVEKAGAEWKSELERKAVSVKYTPPKEEDFEIRDRIRKAGSELYKGRFDIRLKLFRVKDFQILAESQQDAEKIYKLASSEGKDI